MTLVATFHHSHQINNFSVPRPPPCRSSQPVRPQNPPVRNPQTSRSNRDEGELDPITKSQRPKGAAGRSRGEGVVNFLGTAKRGSPKLERGTRERGAGAGSPRLFTRAARRGEPEPGAGRVEAAAVVSSPWRGRDPGPRF